MACPEFDPWTDISYRTTIRIKKGSLDRHLSRFRDSPRLLLEFYCHTGQLMRSPISKFIVPKEQLHPLFDTLDVLVNLSRDQVWTIFVNPDEQASFGY